MEALKMWTTERRLPHVRRKGKRLHRAWQIRRLALCISKNYATCPEDEIKDIEASAQSLEAASCTINCGKVHV